MITENIKVLKKYGYNCSIPGILTHVKFEDFFTTDIAEIDAIISDCIHRDKLEKRKSMSIKMKRKHDNIKKLKIALISISIISVILFLLRH